MVLFSYNGGDTYGIINAVAGYSRKTFYIRLKPSESEFSSSSDWVLPLWVCFRNTQILVDTNHCVGWTFDDFSWNATRSIDDVLLLGLALKHGAIMISDGQAFDCNNFELSASAIHNPKFLWSPEQASSARRCRASSLRNKIRLWPWDSRRTERDILQIFQG